MSMLSWCGLEIWSVKGEEEISLLSDRNRLIIPDSARLGSESKDLTRTRYARL